MKPHKHAELIKQWADGAQIQYRYKNFSDWFDIDNPGWDEDVEFRVKPSRKVIWIIGPKEKYKLMAIDTYEYRQLSHCAQLAGIENPEIIWSEYWWKHVDSPFDLLEMVMSRTR
jgi:endonuclease YncB( thermonuclease family)